MVAVGLVWLMWAVWRSSGRATLESYVPSIAIFITIVVSTLAWAQWARTRRDSGAMGAAEVDRLADLLAMALTDQWTRAAAERRLLMPEPILVRWQMPSVPVTGPVSAAVDSLNFPPLPGMSQVGRKRLLEGQIADLLQVYGGLGSGRLVIAGAPGSGKTSAAVLLVLAALNYRNRLPSGDRLKVPVPVMLSMNEWDPRTQPVRDWLVLRIQQTYPMFAGKGGTAAAAKLIDDMIAVILDGLDEIPC